MANSVILFIEDEDDHFEAVKEHLEPDFKCARSHALGVEAVGKEVQKLKPVAVVLDLMLFTSSAAAKGAATAIQQSIAALESYSRREEPPKYSATAVDASVEIPTMANDWLRELKRKCPGIPIIAFSQLEATVISLEGLVVDAIAKRLDTNTNLLNGKEFADKVRELIKG
jgi:CheY-like chemotaxis protein